MRDATTSDERLRFGLLLDPQYAMDDDVPSRIAELIDLVQAARDLGYDSVYGIHHYLSSLRTLQPLSLMARLIDHTGAMQIGTGILILPLGHPVHWAEEIATIDQLSGGRFVLGVGSGYRENEFQAFGLDRKKRTSRMTESLEVMQALWTGESVSYEGQHFRIDGETCSVLPVQQPHPPVWIGANSPGGIKRAARMGHPWLAPGNVKRNWAIGNLELYQQELREHGIEPAGRTYPIHRDLCIADSREEAFAMAEQYAKASYGEYVQYGMDYFETMWEEIKQKAFFFGTPDEVAERIEDFAAGGFNHFVFRTQWLGAPPEIARQTIERFSREVMPRFSGVPA